MADLRMTGASGLAYDFVNVSGEPLPSVSCVYVYYRPPSGFFGDSDYIYIGETGDLNDRHANRVNSDDPTDQCILDYIPRGRRQTRLLPNDLPSASRGRSEGRERRTMWQWGLAAVARDRGAVSQ